MEELPKSPSKPEMEAQREEPVADEPTTEELNDQENDQVIVNEEDLQGADLSEMGSWILKTLQQQQPDAEITLGSVQVSCSFLPSSRPGLRPLPLFISLFITSLIFYFPGINGHA
jgi:hypothetical protein